MYVFIYAYEEEHTLTKIYTFLRCICGLYDSCQNITISHDGYECTNCGRHIPSLFYDSKEKIKNKFKDVQILDKEETEIYYKLKKL